MPVHVASLGIALRRDPIEARTRGRVRIGRQRRWGWRRFRLGHRYDASGPPPRHEPRGRSHQARAEQRPERAQPGRDVGLPDVAQRGVAGRDAGGHLDLHRLVREHPAMAGDHLHPGNAEDRQSLFAGTVNREHGDAVERPVAASLQPLDRQHPDARGRFGEGARNGVGKEVALVQVHAESQRDRVAHGDLRRLGGGGEGAAVVELGRSYGKRSEQEERCHPERSPCHPERSPCHPERSEGAEATPWLLRCAQDDIARQDDMAAR